MKQSTAFRKAAEFLAANPESYAWCAALPGEAPTECNDTMREMLYGECSPFTERELKIMAFLFLAEATR